MQLSPDFEAMLEDHYGHQVRAMMPQSSRMMMAPPTVAFEIADDETVDAFEQNARDFGINPGDVDWATVIPEIFAAITTGNYFAMIRLGIKYGPAFLKFVQEIIVWFKKPAPTTGGGPVITG